MKNIFFIVGIVLIILSINSCSKTSDSTVPVPNAVTVSINYTVNATPIILYDDVAEDGPYPTSPCGPGGPYPVVIISCGMDASMNFIFHTAIAINTTIRSNPQWCGLGNFGGEIVDIGKVNGLGDVTSKPNSGWSSIAAIQLGHGYVVRYKKSDDMTNAALSYSYARFYADDWVTSSTTNGVIGAKMTYENNF